MRLAVSLRHNELSTHKPLYSKEVVDLVLLDVIAATSRRRTVLDTMIKDIFSTGRVLPLISRLGGEEDGLAQSAQVFGLEGD